MQNGEVTPSTNDNLSADEIRDRIAEHLQQAHALAQRVGPAFLIHMVGMALLEAGLEIAKAGAPPASGS